MLEAGFGGLVLTAKNDERAMWEYYCHQAGRWDDLLIFGPQETLRFNFLDYELNRTGAGAGLTENIVNLFSTVLEVAERNAASGGGREDEGYWRRACRQLVRNVVDLLAFATGRVSVPDLYRVVVSAPTSVEQLRSESWKAESFCFRCLAEADRKPRTPQQQTDFEIVTDYFCLEYPALSDKTRSVIVSTFTSTVDVLNRGLLRTLFCGDTNVTPDVTEEGRIILIDLPVKEFLSLLPEGISRNQSMRLQALARLSEERVLAFFMTARERREVISIARLLRAESPRLARSRSSPTATWSTPWDGCPSFRVRHRFACFGG